MPGDPSLPLLHQDGGICRAAWMLEDAIFGISCDKYPSSVEARNFHLKVQRSEKLYEKALFGLVVLSFIEAPTWCSSHTSGWSWLSGSMRCFAPGNADMFLSGLPYIPPNYGIIVEIVCMTIILRKFLLQWGRELMFFRRMRVEYQARRETYFGISIVFLGFVDCAVYGMFRNHTRLVLVTRSGLLMMLPSVRNLTRVAITVIHDVSFIMMVLFGTILVFAWIAVTIFHDFKFRNVEGERMNDGFDTFPHAVYSMFIASVTEDFIEKFMPTFTACRITGLLWLFFLVLVHLLLLNLVLDTLVAGYAHASEARTHTSAKNQARGVLKAFAACCTFPESPEAPPSITRESFISLLVEMSRSPYLGTISHEIANAFFDAADEKNTGSLDQRVFIDLCKVVNYDFWNTPYHSCFQIRFPSIWSHRWHVWFREFYEAGKFDDVMNIVLVTNLVLIVLESVYDLYDWDEPALLDSLELWFSIIYLMELGLKLSVISWSQFWSFSANQFDFFSTLILLINSALETFPATFSPIDSRYANMLRVLRLLRVLKTVKRLEEVRFMTGTIMKIVALSKEIMTLLGVIIFIFSQVSVQLFGGLLYQGNPKLAGTEYEEKKWYVLNYNDLPMAFAVYFVSLLVEFEPVFAEVISRVAPFKLEWMITLFYYMCACAVVFELVQAFTVETFVELYSKHKKELKRKQRLIVLLEKEQEKSSAGASHEEESDEESDGDEVFSKYEAVEKYFELKGERIHYHTILNLTGEWAKALAEAFDDFLDEAAAELDEGSEVGRRTSETRASYMSLVSWHDDEHRSKGTRSEITHRSDLTHEEEELIRNIRRQSVNPYFVKPAHH